MLISHVSRFTVLFLVLLLSACGGSDSEFSAPITPSTAPTAKIIAADELIEGTTFTGLNATSSSDSNGSVASYLWSIEDNGGIDDLAITDATSASTQLTSIPAELTADITITVSLVVTDNDDEISAKVTKTITLKNDAGDVDTSNFNGLWNSPCFNNSSGFSVRQTININGGVLTSSIKSYTAGEDPALNCVIPSAGGELTESDASVSLNYGSNVSLSNCLNGRGVETDISVNNLNSSGDTYTDPDEISDKLALLTGSVDILPSNSVICRNFNANLLFGGYIYTPGANTLVIETGG